MTRLSLGEKIGIFFDVISKNQISILVLIILIILVGLFIYTNKKESTKIKKIYTIAYSVIIVFVLVVFSQNILKFFDYMMNNFFIAIYFPNLALYFVAILISSAIAFISIFNFNINQIIRNINIIIYTIISFIFVLLIGVISDRNLDIYSQESIYKNDSALALIQLTSTIFILWIVFLIIYYIIRRYQEKIISKKRPVLKKKILPTNLVEIKLPKVAYKINRNQVEINKEEIERITKEKADKYIKEKIKESKELDNLLTKEDYIVLLKLLKEKKREEEKKKNRDDQQSYIKLQEMYESVR